MEGGRKGEPRGRVQGGASLHRRNYGGRSPRGWERKKSREFMAMQEIDFLGVPLEGSEGG